MKPEATGTSQDTNFKNPKTMIKNINTITLVKACGTNNNIVNLAMHCTLFSSYESIDLLMLLIMFEF